MEFEKAAHKHWEAVSNWLNEPHIQEFWDTSIEHKQDILIFMHGRKELSPYWNGMFDYWIGSINSEPYCLLMTSVILSSQTDLPEIWRTYLSKTGKTFSIDFMIGNPKFLGKGLGGQTLEKFTQFIKNRDPKVDTFFIDPAASNPRAKNVYEKGGFMEVAQFFRDCNGEKDVKHFLMIKRLI